MKKNRNNLEIENEILKLEKDNIMRRWNFIVLFYLGAIASTITIWAAFFSYFELMLFKLIYTIFISSILILISVTTLKNFLYPKIIRLSEIDEEIIKNLRKMKE